jgi:predicted P-loop ATPase
MQMRGVWLIELGELSALKKVELNRIKAFITRTTDRFRPPYGRQVITCERQCVFVATSNEFEVLHDPTGNRRWLPFWAYCTKSDEIWRDRDQLWAETVARYRAGGKAQQWWIGNDEPELMEIAKRVQASHVEADIWEEPIAEYLEKGLVQTNGVTIGEILDHALGVVDKSKWNQSARIRIGSCLQKLGWDWKQLRENGERVRRYFRVEQPKEGRPWELAD